MALLSRFRPKFWDHHDSSSRASRRMFNFRTIWKQAVISTNLVALVPLILITVYDYHVTKSSAESENMLRATRLASNTRHAISFYLEERKLVLDFINRDNTYEALTDPNRLEDILTNLNQGMGGFTDLSVIDASGRQRAYFGPFSLTGKDYTDQVWFAEVTDRGVYISDVFLGHRNVPHFVIATRHNLPDGSFFVLRATLDMARFNDLIQRIDVGAQGDVFLVNHYGTIQTATRHHGDVLEKLPMPVPPPAESTAVYMFPDHKPYLQRKMVVYAYIENSPFILMAVQPYLEFMGAWRKTRIELIVFLAVSAALIIIVVLGISTNLVNQIFLADQRRIMALHEVEYSNKMASIGRLAAGVAHEINNPLAIINEKAGLIKDLFRFKHEYKDDPRLLKTVDDIIYSVERCGTITKRMLSFARHLDNVWVTVKLNDLIVEVLSFLEREMEHKGIEVSVRVAEDVPEFVTDRGKLQQILLNLINNAFAALTEGGRIDIISRVKGKNKVEISVADDGCGIPASDLGRVFEPFFSTRRKTGGTGLGLSITFNLVRDLGGTIAVQSQEGEGTVFLISLPLEGAQSGKGVG